MRSLLCCLLFLAVGTFAEERIKRQASYTFPGPRGDRSYRPQISAAPVYVEEQDDGQVYSAPRRQFQGQPVQPQYAPQARAAAPAAPAPAPPAPPPVYEAPRAAAPAPRQQAPAPRRRASTSSSSGRANKYGSAPQQSLNGHDEEDEEEQGPDPLTLLLQDSQFSCGGKNDGYYADDSVNCQVFHYCVGGAKHSWMCPENTVFHQVHLNCVPDAQDICSQSQKFHFVNEYLYKPVDYDGPNKTARYSQRYYPDGYVVGDPLVAPQEQSAPRRPAPQPQSYAPPASAPRPQARQVAPPAPPPQQPSYRAPSQAAYAPQSQSRPASRPARPAESYSEEAQNYRSAPPSRPAQPPPTYRVEQPQPAPQPQQVYRAPPPQSAPPQSYRIAAAQQQAPQPQSGYSSDESIYQPQAPPQSRREAANPHHRPTAAYAPPRSQARPVEYRPSARSASGYQPYASNQAAGVQYDEDY